MLVLNVVIENMERERGGTKQAEVKRGHQATTAFPSIFPRNPSKQINQDSVSMAHRESSHPVLRCVKKKISSEEKLPQDPPAFSPGRGGVGGEAGPTSKADAAPPIWGPPKKGAVHQLTFPSIGTLLPPPPDNTYFLIHMGYLIYIHTRPLK